MHRQPLLETKMVSPTIIAAIGVLLGVSASARAQSPTVVQPHAGDCSIVLQNVSPSTTADTLQIAIDAHDARVLFKIAQTEPLVVSLGDPLRDGSTIYLTLNGVALKDVTVDHALNGTTPPDSCADPGPRTSEYDGRANFEASGFVGMVFDNFAPAQVDPANPDDGLVYKNTPDNKIRKSWTAGVQAQYRLAGRQDSIRQLWLSTQILHGLRTSDVDCRTSPDLAVCKANATVTDRFFAIVEHASTMEAQIDARFEVLRLQVTEETPVKVYVATRFGFLGLAGAPKVFSSDAYVGGGLTAPKGVFRGSFAQVAWGRSRQFQTDPNADRLKVQGTLVFDVAPGLLDQAKNIFSSTLGSTRFFATIAVDRNPRGRAPDSVQSYFGLLFDVRRLYTGF
jgi:hypothetical protein